MRSTPIERASATDRAFLAMDNGDAPEQLGVVLVLDGRLSLPDLRDIVADRILAVPRLHQRLVSVPFACGGPVWVDDGEFDIGHHVHEVGCRAPGDDQALLDTALTLSATHVNHSGTLLEGIQRWGEIKPQLTQEAIVERASEIISI